LTLRRSGGVIARMFKATPNATRTPRKQAERIGTDPAGFDGLPLPAEKLGMSAPREVPYDYRGGHPITKASPSQEYEAAQMKPPASDEPAERAPFDLEPRR
jgi:hypothetical protein